MYLSPIKMKVLSKVIQTLAEPYGEAQVRELVGHQLLELLDADYYASYVWNDAQHQFGDRIALHMDDANLSRYERYYQFQDPITPIMQNMRCPVLVEEVMPQAELVRTEFFNDFLALDGLYWGVNMYAWQGNNNLGDLRIWRHRRRDRFDRNTLEILELLKPAFTAALGRARNKGLVVNHSAAPPMELGFGLMEDRSGLPGKALLSSRENEIAGLAAAGLGDKEIAKKLGIAFTTVRTHLGHAFRKLGVDNRVQLVDRLSSLHRQSP